MQLDDALWFAGSIETNYFLSKITGLERLQAQQLGKLKIDILDRGLVQAGVSTSLASMRLYASSTWRMPARSPGHGQLFRKSTPPALQARAAGCQASISWA